MPKIVITEVDNTSPGIIDESTDVVYIPGFVNVDKTINSGLYDTDGEYVGIKVNEPTLFTSISEFESLCGTEPAYFSADQKYSSLSGIEADGSMTGFSDDAIPYHDTMFYEGQADPAYVMAKEILSAGLCVLYERINNDDYSQTFYHVEDTPSDWNTNYRNYQVASEALVTVTSPSVPEMFTKQNGLPYLNVASDNITYYTRMTVRDLADNATTIAFAPVDDVVTFLDGTTETVQRDGFEQADGTLVPAYYVKNSDLLAENEEETKYFLKSQIYFSSVDPAYEKGLFFIKNASGTYTQLNSDIPPADWGTAENKYYKEGSSAGKYDVVTFTQLYSPEFTTSTYYEPQFTLVEDEEAPADWTTASNKYFSYDTANFSYAEVNTAETEYTAGTYYSITNSTAISGSKPVDWGTAENKYYTREGEAGSYVFNRVEFEPAFTPTFTEATADGSTIITQDADSTDKFVIVSEEPSDWGNTTTLKGFYKINYNAPVVPVEATNENVAPLDDELTIPTGTLYIPHSWIVGYKQGIQTVTEFNPVEPLNAGTADEMAPTWDPANVYRIVSDGISIETMYDALQSIYAITDSGLSDKGNYSIKYLTSGGYPTYEYSQNALVTQMMNLCVERGDCVAFIDHTDNPYRNQNIDQVGSLYYTVKNDLTFQTSGEFATMFTPWATYNRTTTDLDDQMRKADGYDSTVRMPGSFAYFLSLGDSLTVNPNWLAIAGVARGLVQNLASGGMTTNIPNGTADKMSPRDALSINPITNIKPYGYTIWGNRTLKNNATEGNLTATSFLNVRNLVSDIKKEVYRTARKLTFEQNSDVLWVNFKAEVSPLLDRMLHGYGISSYKLQLDTTHPRYNEKATLCVKIIISPIEPVEDFYVSIIMQDDEDAVITE